MLAVGRLPGIGHAYELGAGSDLGLAPVELDECARRPEIAHGLLEGLGRELPHSRGQAILPDRGRVGSDVVEAALQRRVRGTAVGAVQLGPALAGRAGDEGHVELGPVIRVEVGVDLGRPAGRFGSEQKPAVAHGDATLELRAHELIGAEDAAAAAVGREAQAAVLDLENDLVTLDGDAGRR